MQKVKMYTKIQLQEFLQQICVDAEFQVFQYTSPECFTVSIKCRIEDNRDTIFYNKYTKDWIRQFAKFTATRWTVRSSFPKIKRLMYRKLYVSHHTGYNARETMICTKKKTCQAKVDFKIKFINRNTIKYDKKLKDGLNLNIDIEFKHALRVNVHRTAKKVICSAETDNIFCKYFLDGHTPTSAIHYHELILMTENGKIEEGFFNSDLTPVRHLIKLFRDTDVQMMPDIIKDKMKKGKELGAAISHHPHYFGIKVVITPFMKNVLVGHELDWVIVDTSPYKSDGLVTFFLVPTPLGALPIACAIHTDNNDSVNAILLTKNLIESQFPKFFEPKRIMTSDTEGLMADLTTLFPTALVFISRTSMCRVVWTEICKAGNRINSKKQQILIELFYSLLHANNLEEAEKYHGELQKDESVIKTVKLKEYSNEIWLNHRLYIAHNDNIVMDISLCTLKEFMLSKCNNFSDVNMIDVLMNILDKYWPQMLQAILKKRLVIETLTKYLPKNAKVLDKLSNFKIGDNLYRYNGKNLFERGQKKISRIAFRSDTMCCDCDVGKMGRFCEHLTALLHGVEVNVLFSEEVRNVYTKLAGEDTYQEQLQDGPSASEIDVDNDEEEPIAERTLTGEESVKPNEQSSDNLNQVKEETTNENEIDLNQASSSTETIVADMKDTYESTLKEVDDEFRRLNTLFKNNPNTFNLEIMSCLLKELAKIKAIEAVNLSNIKVQLNESVNIAQ